MSGASIISSQQEFTSDCPKASTDCVTNNDLRLHSNKISNSSRIIDLDSKENKEVNYCKNGKCGIRSKLVGENDLKDLLFVLKDCNFKFSSDVKYQPSHKLLDQFYSFPRLLLTNNVNQNQLDPFVLQPSLFHKNRVPPTVYFNTRLSSDSRPPIGLPACLQACFKWKISSITPNTIRDCIAFMKFETIRPMNTTDTEYLGSWCKHMLTAEFSHLEEWRKVNHYPGSFHLGRKDKLWYRLQLANQKHRQDKFESFHPKTFIMPRNYEELCEYWRNSPCKLFIMKPPASARGNGIKVINDVSQVPTTATEQPPQDNNGPTKKSTMIVQQYISNPCLLENGQKFDLRVYVLLTSIDPLRIYVYDEGLVRFASSKYTSQEDGIIDQYMHLTNYFINKNNQKYQINNDCDSLNGCKWTLKRFWRYLSEHHTHIDAQLLWDKIIDIIIQTIICCEGPMTRLSHQNCKNDYTSFELFGFDILLDENFKPWILEVNITPSLKSESDLDTKVKYGVIKDMFNIVGYNLPPLQARTSHDLGKLEDCRLFFDYRFYTENLTRRDKMKQTRYQKLLKMKYESWKTAHLTQQTSSRDLEPIGRVSQVPKIENLEINGIGINNEKSEPRKSGLRNKEMHGDDDLDCAESISDTILNELTQNDLRVLMQTEDELSRCGQFKRVFPSKTSSKYLRYFDKPRYYNFLLDAWERRYRDNRVEGIRRLSDLATFLNEPLAK